MKNDIDTSAVPESLQLPALNDNEKRDVAFIMLAHPGVTSGAAIIRHSINIAARLARRELATQAEVKSIMSEINSDTPRKQRREAAKEQAK